METDSDMVVWPAHVEAIARSKDAAHQAWSTEYTEYMQARKLLAAREAARLQTEAEKERVAQRFAERAARKASPARIQSRDW